MGRPHLYGVHYSPWTERARWALDHHGVPYRYHEHVPLLGERLLRFRARASTKGKASAPLYVDDSGTFGDSLEIIERADAVGDAAPLIGDLAVTRDLRDALELGLCAARARLTARILGDDAALEESATVVSPKLFAPLLRPIAAQGARYVAKKYQADLSPEADHIARMRTALERVRGELDGAEHLAPHGLSARDLMAATFLQFVRPIDARFIPLGPALRRAWSCEELAEEFGDLVQWRDTLYAAHRQAARRATSAA